MKVEINNADETLNKKVKSRSNTGSITVPKSWRGKEVKVTLLSQPKFLTKEQVKFLMEYINLEDIPQSELHQLNQILDSIPELSDEPKPKSKLDCKYYEHNNYPWGYCNKKECNCETVCDDFVKVTRNIEVNEPQLRFIIHCVDYTKPIPAPESTVNFLEELRNLLNDLIEDKQS